ncbi:MAG TPA: hypothetical protein VFR48_06925 [Solirubrobacteraceae bacterium]|nr:hypothetical protein [Solirubrobacteraceae bacterium]
MPGPKRRRSAARWMVGALVAIALVGGAVALADPDESGHARSVLAQANTEGACGPATASTIGAVDAAVARKIYLGELTGHEVGEDVAHVAGSAELVNAVASDSPSAGYAVVHQIVYTPHWHIVRLRVLRNGKVLADVGGPYIIAPISGALRQNGVKVGSFVMSVQDDVGYVKLVTRFTGVPIDLYGGPPPRPASKFLMGTLQPAPRLPSDGATVKAHGVSYFARVAQVNAMPNGKLHVALLVPAPAKALAARSCATVRNSAWGGIVKHVAARFTPLASQYQDFVGTLEGSTGGLAYVREGSLQIAGLNAGPRHLPRSGKVMYHGRPWQVFSWEPHPPARVYFLAPS